MYLEEGIGPWDYEKLISCPFCSGSGLSTLESDCCPHFAVAFQDGMWDHSLCPSVWCNGFEYSRDDFTNDLQKVSRQVDVVRRVKRGTSRHPEIEAFFCADKAVVLELKAKHKKVPEIRPGCSCPECGNLTTVIGEMADDLVCAMCGASCGPCESTPAEPPSWII